MPNLPRPRLRRTRPGDIVAPLPPEPETPKVEEIAAEGLRWVKIDKQGPLEQAWLEEVLKRLRAGRPIRPGAHQNSIMTLIASRSFIAR